MLLIQHLDSTWSYLTQNIQIWAAGLPFGRSGISIQPTNCLITFPVGFIKISVYVCWCFLSVALLQPKKINDCWSTPNHNALITPKIINKYFIDFLFIQWKQNYHQVRPHYYPNPTYNVECYQTLGTRQLH